jgi:Leucine-rich repeat (LRR) protein
MEGLSSLTKLRKLDLSFNKIAKLEGILTLHMLEILEMGKNLVSDAECI